MWAWSPGHVCSRAFTRLMADRNGPGSPSQPSPAGSVRSGCPEPRAAVPCVTSAHVPCWAQGWGAGPTSCWDECHRTWEAWSRSHSTEYDINTVEVSMETVEGGPDITESG